MIIVNVRVPAMEKVYNLSLEEKAKVGDLIDEITELVLQKERQSFSGPRGELVLGSLDSEVFFRKEKTLEDYGIMGGAELILV